MTECTGPLHPHEDLDAAGIISVKYKDNISYLQCLVDNCLECFSYTRSLTLSDGQLLTYSSADKYIIMPGMGQVRSDMVTCRFFFRVDLLFAIFDFSVGLKSDSG